MPHALEGKWHRSNCLIREREREMEGEKRVCVTGAGGFLASWLVKLLLSNGYKVHGTVRDPGSEKNAHLRKLENASENLKLFKADLLNLDSLSAAIAGCEGVFHVASPVPATEIVIPEVEVITPAVTGTLNVLKACSIAKVRRVVVVSSVGAVSYTPHWPMDKLKDEECWSDQDFCKITENWYCLSKTLAESEALKYAEENKLDVVTVCPSMVIGPLLQPTLNGSSLFFLGIVKGGEKPIDNMLWHFVDVRDVANALLLVYEKHEASGRYICAPYPSTVENLVGLLKSMYPNYPYTKTVEAIQDVPMTSEKLKKLGWKCRTLEETLTDTVGYFQEIGVLERN